MQLCSGTPTDGVDTVLVGCKGVVVLPHRLIMFLACVQNVSEQLAEKTAQLQQACQNPLFSPEKPQPGSPSTPRDRNLTAESSSLTLQVCMLLHLLHWWALLGGACHAQSGTHGHWSVGLNSLCRIFYCTIDGSTVSVIA